jgi:hypothetical protein
MPTVLFISVYFLSWIFLGVDIFFLIVFLHGLKTLLFGKPTMQQKVGFEVLTAVVMKSTILWEVIFF